MKGISFYSIMAFVFCLYALNLAAQDFSQVRKYITLNKGESVKVKLYDGTEAEIKLVDMVYVKDRIRKAVREARLLVSVDGVEKWMVAGNYNLPVKYDKIKMDCVITDEYLKRAWFPDGMWRLKGKDAKFRVWPVDKPVNPGGMIAYPIDQKWLTSQTNFELEPVEIDHDLHRPNSSENIYYHWGVDFAGVRGIMPALAGGDGEVIAVGEKFKKGEPIFDITAPRFERIFVKMDNGWVYRYSHLHSFNVTLGQRVKGGDVIAILGNQWSDYAHIHFEVWSLDENGDYVLEVVYPYIWESYINTHKPKLIALARPHKYIGVGDSTTLDGSKSVSFAGNITKYEWTFNDGSTAEGAQVTHQYNKPGYFSEMLQVTDDQGNVAYDFVQVAVVYDDKPKKIYGYSTVSYYPTFNIKAGQELDFNGRYFYIEEGEDVWNFGDGSPEVITHSDPKEANKDGYVYLKHTYDKPGHYVVSFSHSTNAGIVSETRVSVLVEKAAGVGYEDEADHTKEWALLDNYPNPFNPVTIIPYQIARRSHVKMNIFNVRGARVATLLDEVQAAGRQRVLFDASGLAGGVYLCRIEAGGFKSVKRLLLLR